MRYVVILGTHQLDNWRDVGTERDEKNQQNSIKEDHNKILVE
jgi:hypothetical protein